METPIFLLAAVLLLTGCVALPPIDPVFEERVSELQSRTFEVLKEGDSGRLSLAESRRFLHESSAGVKTLRARAVQNHREPDELAALETLEQRYAALLAQPQPLRSTTAKELWAELSRLRQMLAANRSINERIDAGQSEDSTVSSTEHCPPKEKDADKKRGCEDRESRSGRR